LTIKTDLDHTLIWPPTDSRTAVFI